MGAVLEIPIRPLTEQKLLKKIYFVPIKSLKNTSFRRIRLNKLVAVQSWFFFLFFFLISCGDENQKKISISHEVHLIQDFHQPLSFSWKGDTILTNGEQTAYQILLYKESTGSGKDSITWNSQKVQSKKQSFIPFQGPSLEPGVSYYSKVRIWDQADNPSNWSSPKKMVAPLHYPRDWKAEWITYKYSPETPLPIFRKEFPLKLGEEIESARFQIAAPGFYETQFNSSKVGENVLDPAQTNFEDYTFYSTYDIPKDQLKSNNVLEIYLGNGWYNQNIVWDDSMIYGQPVFIAQLEIRYISGRKQTISTDTSWLWTPGPITFTNIYAGETYDARLELDQIDEPTGNQWKKALLAQEHPTKLLQQFAEPIKVMDSLMPKEIKSLEGGKYIFDFGQNFAGWAKLQIEGEKGQEIVIRFAEELTDSGQLDLRSTGVFATKVEQTERYILKGKGREVWQPKFTYHGFRYAEVSGLIKPPEKDLLTGMVVYSSMEKLSNLVTSEPHISKLDEMALWTLKSNLQGIPTDCPHREKCGWTGDAHAIAESVLYNFDAYNFLIKYVLDMRSSGRKEKKELHFGSNFYDRSIREKPKGITTMIAPGKRTSGIATPDWGTAIVQLPWYLYVFYGDQSILHEFYGDMENWINYVHSKQKGGIIPEGLGDWCPPGGNKNIDCPVALSSTAFHILDVSIMKKTSKILGFLKDEKKYERMEIELIKSFNENFLDRKNRTYGSQTGNVLALDMGIVPNEIEKDVAEAIIKDINENYDHFLNTGIFGLSRVFEVLSENGFENEVYELITKKGNNSFEAMWKYHNATTFWEVLPTSILDTEAQNLLMEQSHNHSMQAGFTSWFFSGIGGIRPLPEKPGFKRIIFQPYLTRHIESFSASFSSPYGEIKSDWDNKNNEFNWFVEIPMGSEGNIHVPFDESSGNIYLNGDRVKGPFKGMPFIDMGLYGPGRYHIKVTKN